MRPEVETDRHHEPSKLIPVYVKAPPEMFAKHNKYDFGIIIRYIGAINGFNEPLYEVWIADSNTIRQAFSSDIRGYPLGNRRKR
ncbi:hypothetical protein ABC641_05220 [Lacticaseibacillus paracasei]|uniref:hypothetical protein n=1 Tax=Lacticaseibacillus paracasei TaxID=1597 RepID=UPI000516B001|nr:hypothetical protein [Lacticaseibacillus paracasei]ATG99297.1 hypothetical protein FAM18149p_07855 [Lacticaseibacillus paracasei]MCT3345052.1 hypothetical protein [Lacticaseibacillus paracasei]RND74938.1 hypothetical protein FAM18133_01389 [Lacticaseibacillus paracasei]RND77136.1 hypothetical protein FAM18149_01541 [Lacticaseibacillus paracasei]RND84245.1 hypothetical protein FAM18168_01434 [Lacticaseibacillus paracasei]